MPTMPATLRRRPRAAPLPALAGGALCAALLVACAPGSSPPASASGSPTGLLVASSGLCRARQALPDVVSAEQAFTNFAHDPLHVLAADGRLDRGLAAKVLETMATVEEDIRASSAADTLAADLDALQAAADEALRSINEVVPPCD